MDHFCPACGYNLYGIPEERCPECGLRYDLRAVQSVARSNANASTDFACYLMAWSIVTIGLMCAPMALMCRLGIFGAIMLASVVLIAGLFLRRVLYTTEPGEWMEEPGTLLLGAVACLGVAVVVAQLPDVGRLAATGLMTHLWVIQIQAGGRFEYFDLTLDDMRRHRLKRLERMSRIALWAATAMVASGWVVR